MRKSEDQETNRPKAVTKLEKHERTKPEHERNGWVKAHCFAEPLAVRDNLDLESLGGRDALALVSLQKGPKPDSCGRNS